MFSVGNSPFFIIIITTSASSASPVGKYAECVVKENGVSFVYCNSIFRKKYSKLFGSLYGFMSSVTFQLLRNF